MIYSSQSRVEAYLNRELTDNEASLIDDVIDYMSSFISTYCNREWLPVDAEDSDPEDIEASARLFDGSGGQELYVDDFIGLEKIELLDRMGNVLTTFDQNSDWMLAPLNKNPKQSIRLRTSRFHRGSGNVQVTAVWGTGNVPSDVVIVCTALSAKYLQKTGGSTGTFKKESIEGYSYELMTGAEVDADRERLLTSLDKWKKFIL